MNKLMETVSRGTNKVLFAAKKHAPELLVATAIGAGVGAVVSACFATRKLDGILEDHEKDVQLLNDAHEGKIKTTEEYSEEDYKKDLTITYVKTGLKVAKVYAPTALLSGISIASILGSHKILSGRNAALASAYALADKGFKEYRKRVVEELGEDMDRHFRLGTKLETIEVQDFDEETGKTKKHKETIEILPEGAVDGYSIYSRFYDEACAGYSDDPEVNLWFLKTAQQMFTDRLRVNGHVFLNDVYEYLGIPKTKAGQLAGWVYKSGNDDYVDFGIYKMDRERNRAFVNGYEPVILLDFNCQGNILDTFTSKEL